MSITSQGMNKGNHDSDSATGRLSTEASSSELTVKQERASSSPIHARFDDNPATTGNDVVASAMDRFLEQVKAQCDIVGALLVKADDMHFVPFDPDVMITDNGSAPINAERPYFTVQKRSIPFADGCGMILITSIATVVGLS